MAYIRIRDQVRDLFHTNAPLLPGIVIGTRKLSVRGKSTIGGLTMKKLKAGIDFIWNDLGWIVSSRVADLLDRSGCKVPLGNILFSAGGAEFRGYKVIELERTLAWTESQRAKYRLTICEYCGSNIKEVSGGTFSMKEFDGVVFREGCVIVRAAETSGFCINETLYERLLELRPQGVSFDKCGEWV